MIKWFLFNRIDGYSAHRTVGQCLKDALFIASYATATGGIQCYLAGMRTQGTQNCVTPGRVERGLHSLTRGFGFPFLAGVIGFLRLADHFAVPLKDDTIGNLQLCGTDITLQLSAGHDLKLRVRLDITVHGSVDDHALGLDVRLDDRALTHHQKAL